MSSQVTTLFIGGLDSGVTEVCRGRAPPRVRAHGAPLTAHPAPRAPQTELRSFLSQVAACTVKIPVDSVRVLCAAAFFVSCAPLTPGGPPCPAPRSPASQGASRTPTLRAQRMVRSRPAGRRCGPPSLMPLSPPPLAAPAASVMKNLNYQVLHGRMIRVMPKQTDPSLRKSGVANVFVRPLPEDVTNRVRPPPSARPGRLTLTAVHWRASRRSCTTSSTARSAAWSASVSPPRAPSPRATATCSSTPRSRPSARRPRCVRARRPRHQARQTNPIPAPRS